MRTAVPPDIAARVAAALDAVERGADGPPRVILAVESGSRAWGFPSPDSDRDLRFVYAMPTAWHLRLSPGRDVVEAGPEGDPPLDLAGWEARKAVDLLLSGNATLREWLASPITYREHATPRAAFVALADAVPARAQARFHHASLAKKQFGRQIGGRDPVALKKYLYAVRPALALRWMRENPGEAAPPMDMAAPRAGTSLPPGAVAALDDLLARKAVASELGAGPPLPDLDALIAEEVAAAEVAAREEGPVPRVSPAAREAAQALFLRCVAHADEGRAAA